MTKLLLITFFLLSGCGEFTYGPYVSNVKEVKRNENNIERIFEREALFDDKYKVAVISDTHRFYAKLKKVIKFINKRADEYAFVAILGDVSDYGLIDEYKESIKLLRKLDLPYVVVIGNHDNIVSGEKLFSKMFGPNNFNFEFKNTEFIFFNNNSWETDNRYPRIGWIQEKITRSRSKSQVLLSHVPITDTSRFTLKERTSMFSAAEEKGIRIALNGHNHVPSVKKIGDVTKVTVGSIEHNVMVELSIDNGVISYEHLDF